MKVEGDIGTIGITNFAQEALGDIIYVDLPDIGDEFDKHDSFAELESVKAVSDVYSPVTGARVPAIMRRSLRPRCPLTALWPPSSPLSPSALPRPITSLSVRHCD